MIDLRSHGAVQLESGLPIELVHVRTLEAFEGPLLAEFRSAIGDPYLYYWCDRETGENIDRWIVIRTPTQDLTRYLVGAVTLRDLILKCRDRFVYLLDIDHKDLLRDAFFMAVDSLPLDYIPAARSQFKLINRINETQQDVFIDEVWDYQQISEYPRRYLQAYGFNALFGPHGDPSELRTVGYKLTQGYVYNTLFVNFGAHVPVNKRASLMEVSVAFPRIRPLPS